MHVNGTQNCVLVHSYCSYDAHHVDGNMYREVGAALWSYHKRPRPLSNNTSTTHWWWSNADLSPDETLSHHIRCWKCRRSGRGDTNWRIRIVTFPPQEWLQSRAPQEWLQSRAGSVCFEVVDGATLLRAHFVLSIPTGKKLWPFYIWGLCRLDVFYTARWVWTPVATAFSTLCDGMQFHRDWDVRL
jgi:hypothetical protein